jgi:MarR family transcriptional regulator, organic hydroperoxide resistance regulator
MYRVQYNDKMQVMETGQPITTTNNLALGAQLCFPLYAATNMLIKLYGPYLNVLGLTYSQFLVMLTLWEKNGQMVTEIGRTLRLDTGTLTPLLKRLEGMGLVERYRPADDKRRVLILLTKEGEALQQKALHTQLPVLTQHEVPGCTDADLPGLRDMLYTLLHRMDKIAEESQSGTA